MNVEPGQTYMVCGEEVDIELIEITEGVISVIFNIPSLDFVGEIPLDWFNELRNLTRFTDSTPS